MNVAQPLAWLSLRGALHADGELLGWAGLVDSINLGAARPTVHRQLRGARRVAHDGGWLIRHAAVPRSHGSAAVGRHGVQPARE